MYMYNEPLIFVCVCVAGMILTMVCFRDISLKWRAVLGKVLVQTGAFVPHTRVMFVYWSAPSWAKNLHCCEKYYIW